MTVALRAAVNETSIKNALLQKLESNVVTILCASICCFFSAATARAKAPGLQLVALRLAPLVTRPAVGLEGLTVWMYLIWPSVWRGSALSIFARALCCLALAASHASGYTDVNTPSSTSDGKALTPLMRKQALRSEHGHVVFAGLAFACCCALLVVLLFVTAGAGPPAAQLADADGAPTQAGKAVQPAMPSSSVRSSFMAQQGRRRGSKRPSTALVSDAALASSSTLRPQQRPVMNTSAPRNRTRVSNNPLRAQLIHNLPLPSLPSDNGTRARQRTGGNSALCRICCCCLYSTGKSGQRPLRAQPTNLQLAPVGPSTPFRKTAAVPELEIRTSRSGSVFENTPTNALAGVLHRASLVPVHMEQQRAQCSLGSRGRQGGAPDRSNRVSRAAGSMQPAAAAAIQAASTANGSPAHHAPVDAPPPLTDELEAAAVSPQGTASSETSSEWDRSTTTSMSEGRKTSTTKGTAVSRSQAAPPPPTQPFEPVRRPSTCRSGTFAPPAPPKTPKRASAPPLSNTAHDDVLSRVASDTLMPAVMHPAAAPDHAPKSSHAAAPDHAPRRAHVTGGAGQQPAAVSKPRVTTGTAPPRSSKRPPPPGNPKRGAPPPGNPKRRGGGETTPRPPQVVGWAVASMPSYIPRTTGAPKSTEPPPARLGVESGGSIRASRAVAVARPKGTHDVSHSLDDAQPNSQASYFSSLVAADSGPGLGAGAAGEYRPRYASVISQKAKRFL